MGSSIAREADSVFYTVAGPEIAVATTKAYSTQLIVAYTLAMQFGLVRGELKQGTISLIEDGTLVIGVLTQADFTVYVPKVDDHFEASMAVIPLQLLGYYMA